jgi:NTE family protein
VAVDQMVLGSGGVLGDTWMSGLTAGLLDAGGLDLRQSSSFVGTSAGSIVATRLAAGEDLRGYIRRRFGSGGGQELTAQAGIGAGGVASRKSGADDRTGGGPLGAVASTMLGTTRPAGALLRRVALKAVPEGGEELARLGRTIDRLMPDWDPRLNLVGVEVRSGSRIVIKAGDSQGLTVSEAVRASCAIPGVFSPVDSARGPIVDGGVWSPVNLDAVRPPPGSNVLCLYPSGYHSRPRSLRRSAATSVSRARVAIEAAAMRRHGVRVMVVAPDEAAAAAIGPSRMDHSRDEAVAAAGYRQGNALAGRLESWLGGATSHRRMHPKPRADA